MPTRPNAGMITVPIVVKSLGFAPLDLPSATSAGAQAREAWMRRSGGVPPPKDNTPKSNGGGSHCHALYPEDFRPVIESIVRAFTPDETREPRLL